MSDELVLHVPGEKFVPEELLAARVGYVTGYEKALVWQKRLRALREMAG